MKINIMDLKSLFTRLNNGKNISEKNRFFNNPVVDDDSDDVHEYMTSWEAARND
ncbi:MAG: hypothetical protein KAT71_01595 [Gammaproteobacteria bacterium]|nr:hypothetical protein [Gammaproteobacteria bacterium]